MHRAALVVALALAAVTGVAVLPERAEAVITNPFTSRFSVNTNGSILLRGNTNLQCPASVGTCVPARSGTGSAATEVLNNNGYDMEYTNADNDSNTFNDSASTITMPAGSTVLYAALYWSADPSAGTNGHAALTPADVNKVRFSTPGGGGWNQLTADTTYQPTANKAYQGVKDVTRLVAGAGNGTYRVADIQSGTGRDRYAGWALAIVYQNSAEHMHRLQIFDGFGVVSSSSTSVTIPVTGFQTPQSGTVDAKIGTVVYEGDLGKTGDTLQLNAAPQSDAVNLANNFFNSTVSDAGAMVTDRDPGWTNLMGVDIDHFDASGKLANNATSANLTLTTTGETFYPGVVTFTTDLYAPKLVTTTTANDLNGGTVKPGDVIEYRIDVRNDGTDTATLSTLVESFPTGTTYVPGTLTLAGAPVADGGSTQATFDLGTLPYQASTYVTFRVKVDPTAATGSTIVNVPNVTFQGSSSQMTIAGVNDTSTLIVQRPDADLVAGLTVAPTPVQRRPAPNAISYTATIRNDGPDIEPRPSVTITLPAGVTAGTLPGNCAPAGGSDVTCVLSYLAAHTSGSVTVPAYADNTTANVTRATATVAGSGLDPDHTNDTDTARLEVNSAPHARSETASTANGAAVTVDVLANDDDPENPKSDFSVSITTPPQHGTASVNADWTITYTPDPAWRGADTFGYTLDDGHGGTDTATDTVTTANGAPVGHDDTVASGADTPVTVDVLANDTDPNGDTRTLDSVDPPQAGAGTTAISNGQVLYTPDPAFAGVAVFTYTVADGNGGTATATVRVTVANAVPVAADDPGAAGYLGATDVDVLGNDTDANHDTLTVTAVGTPDHGTATIVAGKIHYVAPAGFSGDATFSYTISDGTATATAHVVVTVADAPPVAANQTPATNYHTPITLDVAADATDPNHDTLSVTGTGTASHGSVVRNPDGTITYSPDAGFSGVDHFTYTIGDGRGGSDTGTVTVTVRNAAPTAHADAVTVSSTAATMIDVRANDTDPNGDTLTVSIDGPPGHGTAYVAGDMIVYTPAAGFHGTDTLHYQVSDGHGGTSGATVTVVAVNVPPVAVPDAAVTDTDSPVTVSVLANDTDPNGDLITLAALTPPAHGTAVRNPGGTITYTPVAGFHGTDAFTYTITDSAGLTSTTTVAVTVHNAAPIALDDRFLVSPGGSTVLNVMANDSDPNTGQVLSVQSVSGGTRGIVTLAGGKVTYTPRPGAGGTDTFTYVLTDDLGATSRATVTVVIDGVPVTSPDTVATPAGTAITINVLANDTDPDGDPISVVAVGSPAHGTATLVGGKIQYTPAAGFTGTDTFTYTVRDTSGNDAVEKVTVHVANADPVANPDSAAVLTGHHLDLDVLGNDTDPNTGQHLTITAVGSPAHGTAELVGGRIRYTPADGFAGTDTFTYEISDGAGGTAQGTVAVTVSDGDPVAVPDRRTTTFQHPVTVPVLDNDLDPAGTLALDSVGTPDHGTATIQPGGKILYTPPAGFSGVATFEYTAKDDAGHTTTATVTVVVGPAPIAPDKAVRAKPGKAATITAPTVDKNGIKITVRSIGKPAHGTAKLNANGTITYTPDDGFTGKDSFPYEAVDADGNTTTGTITVTVASDAKPPVAKTDRYTVVSGDSSTVLPTGNDTDPYRDKLSVVKVGHPQHGTAVLNADGTVTYRPSDGYTGTDTFPYAIKDAHGGQARATIVFRVTAAVGLGALPKTGLALMPLAATGGATLLCGAILYVLTAFNGPTGGRHRPGRHRGA